MSDHCSSGSFEGVEKRIIIQLKKSFFQNKSIKSLLDIDDDVWKRKLTFIGCRILSKIHENVKVQRDRQCSAYLLSESSLFVCEDKLFLKTCGKTKVLFFIPILAKLLLNVCEKNKTDFDEDTAYDENWLQRNDIQPVIDFIENNFEYVLFTHMNYKNHEKEKEDVFIQEYPHRTLKEEKYFFSYFLKSMQFITTALPQNKTHNIFFARLNQLSSCVDTKFCSEFVAFVVNSKKVKKDFHRLYLNEESLQVLQNRVEFVKLYGVSDESKEDVLVVGGRLSDSCLLINEVENTLENSVLLEENSYYMEKGNVKKKDHLIALTGVGGVVPDGEEGNRMIPNTFLTEDHTMTETVEGESVYRTSLMNEDATTSSSRNMSITSAYVKKRTIIDVEKGFNSDITKEYISDVSTICGKSICNKKDTCMSNTDTNDSIISEDHARNKANLENEKQETINELNKLSTEDTAAINSGEMQEVRKMENIEIEELCALDIRNQYLSNKNCYRAVTSNPYYENFTIKGTKRDWDVDSDEDGGKIEICVKNNDEIVYEYKNKKKETFSYDEYYFNPCGFSCNAVNERNYFCTHYSPEESVSYVSVELSNDLNIEKYVTFIKKQMQFYCGKYVYIINYLNNTNKPEEKDNGDEIQESNMLESDTAESFYLKNELMKICIINKGHMYYELMSFKEQSVDSFRIQYFSYELKTTNKDIMTKSHLDSIKDVAFSGDDNIIKEVQRRYAKSKYNVAYNFCKKHKIRIVQLSSLNNYDVANDLKWHSKLKEKQHNESDRIPEQNDANQIMVRNEIDESENHETQYVKALDAIDEKKLIQMENMARVFENNISEMYMFQRILNENLETSVMCINLRKILSQFIRFKSNLPNVTPFYSVKSNNDEVIINLLYELNCNFDCASKGEIKRLLKCVPNISRDRIIYANTIKSVSSLIYAQNENINLCTFDNLEELKKIAKWHPTCSLLLRINVDFGNNTSYMSTKYGANINEWKELFKYAKTKQLKITGISFHVGSNNKSLMYYCEAIKRARAAWNCGESFGFHMEILNIGGGFPEELEEELKRYHSKQETEQLKNKHVENLPTANRPVGTKLYTLSDEEVKVHIQKIIDGEQIKQTENIKYTFEHTALAIKMSISHHFGDIEDKLKIISEPGRYFVNGSALLAVKVVGKRYPLHDMYESTEGTLREKKQSSEISMNSLSVCTNVDKPEQGDWRQVCDDTSNRNATMLECADTNIELSGINKSMLEKITSLNKDNVKLDRITDIKKKVVDHNRGQHRCYAYYVNESIYGCFTNIIFDEYNRVPAYVIKNKKNANPICNNTSLYSTTIFGHSCDGLDMINSEVYLPVCNINDWIIYEYVGAYSFVSSSVFNGFEQCKKFFIFSK